MYMENWKRNSYKELKFYKYKELREGGKLVKTWNEVVKSDMLGCGVLENIALNRDEWKGRAL